MCVFLLQKNNFYCYTRQVRQKIIQVSKPCPSGLIEHLDKGIMMLPQKAKIQKSVIFGSHCVILKG